MERLTKWLKSGISAKQYKKSRKQIDHRNAWALRMVLIGSVAAFGLPIIGSLFRPDLRYMRIAYAVIVAVSIALLFLSRHARPATILVLVYATFAVDVIYATFASAFLSPDYVCVTILGTLFLMQVLILDMDWRINLLTVISAAFYLVVSIPQKNSHLITDEVVNVLSFLILGMAVGLFFRRTQMHSFEIQESLRMSEEQNRMVLKQSGNIICRFDVEKRSMELTQEAAAFFGANTMVTDMPQRPVRDGAVSPENIEGYLAFFEDILNGKESGSVTFRGQTAKGWRWLRAKQTTGFSDAGTPAYAVLSFMDVTEQREKEMAYERWKQELAEMAKKKSALFQRNLSRDIVDDESGEILSQFRDLPSETYNGRTFAYAQRIHPDDRENYIMLLNRERLLAEYNNGNTSFTLSYRELRPDKSYRWMQASIQLIPYPDSSDIKAYLVLTDVDDERRHALDTEEKARRDGMTGLFNRRAFIEKVNGVLSKAPADARYHFMMLDIDYFKAVNDTLGHIAGDELLADMAKRLRRITRQSDLLGRIGGDEFAVFVTDIPDAAAEALAGEICRSMRRRLDEKVGVSVSIGVARSPEAGTDFHTLYRNADAALYIAKHNGRDQYAIFEPKADGETPAEQ